MDIWEELKAKRKTETILDMLKCNDYKFNDKNKCYYCYFHIEYKHIKFILPLYTQEWELTKIDYMVSKIKNKIKEMIENG